MSNTIKDEHTYASVNNEEIEQQIHEDIKTEIELDDDDNEV